ncbi:hypothetical protein SOVF_058740 [Spinacia oleracea]|nr:hypothetical protein SOVF_058740 [Spinacia oleracea]
MKTQFHHCSGALLTQSDSLLYTEGLESCSVSLGVIVATNLLVIIILLLVIV